MNTFIGLQEILIIYKNFFKISKLEPLLISLGSIIKNDNGLKKKTDNQKFHTVPYSKLTWYYVEFFQN